MIRCSICKRSVSDKESIYALFNDIGKICIYCDRKTKRVKPKPYPQNGVNTKTRKFINDYESGKLDIPGLKVKHRLVQNDGSVATFNRPLKLTPAGNLKK